MKAFVSGGAGVIGRELVALLRARGDSVIVGDLQPRPEEFREGVEYIQGDLNDLKTFPECDVFYHLAATFERLEESPEHFEKNFQHNVRLSHHLLSLCPKSVRVVFASSYLVYGKPGFDGRRDIKPRNLTGAAKFYTECEMEVTHPNSVSARIYRSYGKGSRDIISRSIRAGLRGEVVQIYGIQNAFDFIYAGDVAEGLVVMGDSPLRGSVDLGTGAATCIWDIMCFIKCKTKAVLRYVQYEYSKADMEPMREATSWTAKTNYGYGITKIEEYERGKL